ncbi:NAD(P)-binding domain-containing protein [Streptosporangiaceae bacterium NEAU-GS5]|nr:NAD(P)-binding domain-containing protein [Streptosporangiaceae bacterium NEAU-GS5]
MRTTDIVIIGAGQAGLAVSRCLTEQGRDHVVLERGRVGQRWRGSSWDSLHLLTPNWLNALPGSRYHGPDQDGFSSATAFADRLVDYARSYGAPVVEHADVRSLRTRNGRFETATDDEAWRSAHVVIATGWCDRPAIPAMARALASDVHQVAPSAYRNPDALPPGGVLVVGASATGVQLADELAAAGREVTIAVGGHTRLLRTYRGMDIYWWLDRIGHLDKTIDEMPDGARARHEPSAQLIGTPDRRPLDLATLRAAGVRLAGRVTAVDGHRIRLAPDLPATMAAAETRLRRLLDRIDTHIDPHIDAHGLGHDVREPRCVEPVAPADAVTDLDLRAAGIRTVIWATGHRRSYPWLRLPVLDRHNEIRQYRGQTPMPGLHVLGQRFQHRRNSNHIGGVGRDATALADHMAGRRRPPAQERADAPCL